MRVCVREIANLSCEHTYNIHIQIYTYIHCIFVCLIWDMAHIRTSHDTHRPGNRPGRTYLRLVPQRALCVTRLSHMRRDACILNMTHGMCVIWFSLMRHGSCIWDTKLAMCRRLVSEGTLCVIQPAPEKTKCNVAYCTTLQRTTTYCATLQPLYKVRLELPILIEHRATHCNTHQYTATHSNPLQTFNAVRLALPLCAQHCSTQQHTAVHCNSLQHTEIQCKTLQHTAAHSNTLQPFNEVWLALPLCTKYIATHCNTLQYTAMHCNTLQPFNEVRLALPLGTKHNPTPCLPWLCHFIRPHARDLNSRLFDDICWTLRFRAHYCHRVAHLAGVCT